MKKTILAGISAAFLSHGVSADTLAGVYMGAQGWRMDTQGGFANQSDTTEFDFDANTHGNLYIAVEHPVPLLPNVKLSHSAMDTRGQTTLDQQYSFGGRDYNAETTLNTQADMSQTDVVLYYELFDNDLISLDLGLNTKMLDGDIYVEDADEPENNTTESFTGVVPMLYSRVALGLPMTNWSLYAEGSFLSFGDSSLYDYQAALTYEFVDNLAVDMEVQLGYRSIKLELNDMDNIYTDVDFSGPFAGIQLHF